MEESAHTREGSVRKVLEHISRMPSLSVTVTRVLAICNNPATSASDLNRIIALDPVLMGQVLKLINSAYYGLRSSISSLPRAIIMLGMNTVKNLVLSSAVMTTLGSRSASRAFSMEQFWLHSLCVGVGAKWLATIKGVPLEQREDFFVGGLLHDLGKIPLAALFPDEYGIVIKTDHGQLSEVEQDAFGIDHMQVGGMIAEKWKLGPELEDCLRQHHDPEAARQENAATVRVITLANMCANHFRIGESGDAPLDNESLERHCATSGFNDIDLDQMKQALTEEVEKARVFLQLNSGKGAP